MVTLSLTTIHHAPQHSTWSLRVAWRWKTGQGPPVPMEGNESIGFLEGFFPTFPRTSVGFFFRTQRPFSFSSKALQKKARLFFHFEPQIIVVKFKMCKDVNIYYNIYIYICMYTNIFWKMNVYNYIHIQHVAYDSYDVS